MKPLIELQDYLSTTSVSPEVFSLQPDYRAVLLAVSGIDPGQSDSHSESLLLDAESSAREQLSKHASVNNIPHVCARQEAYKSFGAKPKKHRNSVEALIRRITPEQGLPRVNRLTDIYNSISVKYQIPLGGEDLDKYTGAARLIIAKGDEKFEVKERGEIVVEKPDKGEVCWVEDYGVTCRRWNWRQGPRTALSDDTKNALFICDALGAMSDEELNQAVEALERELKKCGDNVQIARRIITKESYSS